MLASILIRKKNFQSNIDPIAAAYLEMEENRPELHQVDGHGFSPLHYAVLKQDIPLTAVLVAAGADIRLPVTKTRKLFKT